ncbi:lysylphosphatidylglycerol synthase transmembrane domain-containing protein [Cypionkella psychrotolerans]|uniref:lysylphosphatidylglycerol synthase transmembrane domain-containing protein n=1 Tax=Cypionkella psychrotolerans TaxID=1678131 RepID=UPI0006B5A870|nr:YbhN family protein [Cypionkella psychrotolerans]
MFSISSPLFKQTSAHKYVLYATVTAAVMTLAFWLLRQVQWSDILASVGDLSAESLIAAALATGFSFCGLVAYDVIAVRHLRLSGISNRRAAAAGAVAYGVTNFIGFPWLTGAMVRNVFYRDTVAGIGALMTVVLSSWVAFWVTAAAIIGAVLLLDPEITMRAGLTSHGGRLGVALLLGVARLMIWQADGRHIMLVGQRFTLLKRRVTLAQCGAALVDLTGSAAVLYVFLPAEGASDVASFFVLFVVAVGAGVLSHIPAGVGAFEGRILLGMQGVDQSAVTTALVMYRAMRTVLPFLLASLVLVALAFARRDQPEQAS